ncbi:hypothetical protein [Aliikangiella sp. G2MR2-5]|uniref:hypothetical protein n=1 Tax=Aliikangiella sp. G2MR2-5 TaxID=2788943 RepID=UPI0018AA873F|nr:hypothetical protein [Aliikangiella sp. G2MR2-5]
MKQNSGNISVEEAKDALMHLDNANQLAEKYLRPPLVFRVVMTFIIGGLTYAAAMSSGSSLWTFVCSIFTIALLVTMLVHYFYLRSQGVKVRICPLTRFERWFSFVSGFVVAAILVGAMQLEKAGYSWIPIVSGTINGLLAYYMFSNFTASGARIKSEGE